MKKLSVILLAAGQSKRMGQNKLLLPMEGQTLLRRTAQRILEADVGPLSVVTGHESTRAHEVLEGLPIHWIHNPDYASGLLSSLQAGLRNLPPDSQGAMVVLADQVFLNPAYLKTLATEFQRVDRPVLIAPAFAGQRGHPVVIERSFFEEILNRVEQLEKGAQFLFQRHADAVRILNFPAGLEAEDLDTPEDYERISSSIGPDAVDGSSLPLTEVYT